ncbi:MAG: Imm1 family immunity protein [Acidobacteriota bacterium]
MVTQVVHLGGTMGLGPASVLEEILELRFENGMNEFSLHGEDDYPYLSLMVRQGQAYLHFFPEEGHPGFHSVGDDDHRGTESVAFPLGTLRETVEVPLRSVISTEQAIQAAIAFARTGELPAQVQWDEL